MFAAGVNGGNALRADREFRLVGAIQKDLHGVLALRNVGRRRLKFWNFIAGEVLTNSIASPNTVNLPGEDLTGIEIEGQLDRLSGPHERRDWIGARAAATLLQDLPLLIRKPMNGVY